MRARQVSRRRPPQRLSVSTLAWWSKRRGGISGTTLTCSLSRQTSSIRRLPIKASTADTRLAFCIMRPPQKKACEPSSECSRREHALPAASTRRANSTTTPPCGGGRASPISFAPIFEYGVPLGYSTITAYALIEPLLAIRKICRPLGDWIIQQWLPVLALPDRTRTVSASSCRSCSRHVLSA